MLRELHARLRTEGDSPARYGLAVGLGTLIGCVPLYGTHLALCAVLAGVLRLNRLVTYLAAHINNPVTAPWLLAVSFALGHRLVHGAWPPWRPAEVARLGLWNVGGDLLLGGVVLGAVLGPLFGAAAFVISRRSRRPERWSRIVRETSRRYLGSGVLQWEFAHGKLTHDPLYEAIETRLDGLRAGTVLDLGCGRGIALALLDTALRTGRDRNGGGPIELRGVDRNPGAVQVARAALGDRAHLEVADLATFDPPGADVVLLLDVLHYMAAEEQVRLVARAARALRPGGRLLLREPDASDGLRFQFTRAAERLNAVARAEWSQRFHYRSEGGWLALLRGQGLAVTVSPASRGTPFSNLLFEGQAAGVQSRGGAGRPAADDDDVVGSLSRPPVRR